MHLDGTSFHVHGEYENTTEKALEESINQAVEELPTTEKLEKQLLNTHQKSEAKESEQHQENEEPKIIEITYGYSRDHRPDLKQYLVNIMSSSDGDIPLFFHVGDGNESEKSRFPLLIQEFKKQWSWSEIKVFVADSALYSAENITTFLFATLD